MAIRVFFSWQSDVAQNATTRAIRLAVARAAAFITDKYGRQVISDEATRNVPGSPYIPAKLAEKIRTSDVFIGDITSIAVTPEGKSLPNSNVTFELGLAAAHLGWDRVILLFNEKIAAFDKLPFDFDRHRISRYKIAEGKAASAKDQKVLDDLVMIAIDTILDQQPLRPRELEGKSESQTKHDRDVVNLRWFFRHMSVDLLGMHTREMPEMLHYFAPVMYDGLNGVLNSPSFRLYDAALEKRLRSLVRDLGKTLAYDGHYRELNISWVQAFGQRGPYVDRQAELAAASEIRKAVRSLARDLDRVVQTVRANFLEVDLDELSQRFGLEYNQMIKAEKGG